MPFQMNPDHPNYIGSPLVDSVIARAVARHAGSDKVLGYVEFDETTNRLTLTDQEGNQVTTPAFGEGEGSGLAFDPDNPAVYDPETGILTLTFSNGSTILTDDLRGSPGGDGEDGTDGDSAFDLAKADGFTGTLEQWLGLVDPDVLEVAASRDLASGDAYRRLRGTSDTDISITIQTDATAILPARSYFVLNAGAGALTITAAPGVTLNGVDGGSITLAQYQAAAVEKITPDAWIAPNAQVA